MRSVQETSVEAYHSLKDLGRRQRTVLSVLEQHPASNTEISRKLNLPINVITPRVKELRKMGLVEDKGTRVCPYTGRTVHVWGVREVQLDLF